MKLLELEKRMTTYEADMQSVRNRQDICDADRIRYAAWMRAMDSNTAVTTQNSKKQEQMINMFDDMMAAMRGLAALGKVLKWVAGIGAAWFAVTKGINLYNH